MTTTRVLNPGSVPVVVSREGHQLGGGETGEVETRDPLAKAALEAELIVKAPTTEKGGS